MDKISVAELHTLIGRENLAEQISQLWSQHNNDRQSWIAQKKELRDYIFATDTTTTSNAKLPWKNKTTIPKLCQIRDNLHANYMSALFPNDNWMKWEAYTKDSATKEKRDAIQAYMSNKVRESDLRNVIDQLLYDYIDYGNCIYDVEWVAERHEDENGIPIPGYIGPKASRISPLDHVFNPLASSYDNTYKITRYVKTIGEMMQEIEDKPELSYNREVVERAHALRKSLTSYGPDDVNKAAAFSVDGFGTLYQYYQSGYVEILEFEGSLHDLDSNTLHKNRIITIIDRCYVVRNEPMPSWFGKSTKGHAAWRKRPDNLWGMGPLDNLVGMQYRIDHLENLKADAMDLSVHPPLAITGSVEEFVWEPGAEILLGEGGSVAELGKNLNGVIAANSEIAQLELKMEELAGAPKQAMGIRTPGEKTAFEVQTLEMAASRIFQHKIQNFEVNVLEPMLNRMLEVARRNMDGSDVVRVLDNDLGVLTFFQVTKEDITASGKIRPMGARHFAANATRLQTITQLSATPLWQDPAVQAHISGKKMAKLIEELLDAEPYDIVEDNIRVLEQIETQQIASQGAEDVMVADATPTEAPEIPEE